MEYIVDSEGEYSKLIPSVLGVIGPVRVVLFYGDLGSGKTTLIQYICRHLGVEEAVTSPTFAIVNEYLCRNGEPVYHMDFYRIKTLGEALMLGLEEYLDSGYYCFVEWPELIEPVLPGRVKRVYIEVIDQKTRKFVIL